MVPARIALTKGQIYQDGDVRATDAKGDLPLRIVKAPALAGQPIEPQLFIPGRETSGDVTLNYSARVTDANSPRPRGPSYDLRGTEGGFGGSFFSFLPLPLEQRGAADIKVTWDFSRVGSGAEAASTRGPGDLAARISPDELRQAFFLAGRLEKFRSGANPLFSAYWIGTPPFDARARSEWTGRSLTVLQQFFRDREARPYTLLMRPFPLPRDGGGAARGGFMLEYGFGKLGDASRQIMFTHEMIHHFVGSLEGDSSALAWYGEGLAEYYKTRLPYRAGMLTLREVADETSFMTNAYYTSPLVAASYDEVSRNRWAGGAAQGVPYNRGFIYFVDLNAKIVKASGGARSLDHLVLAMLERKHAGQSYDIAAWREMLRAELGDAGPRDLEAMLAGQLIIPPDDAFGPCLHRVEVATFRQDLGFSEDSILVHPRVVAGLDPASHAARSGLREGDAIVSVSGATERIAHSAANLLLAPKVSLVVKREGTTKKISFSTRVGEITEYRWKTGKSSSQCSI